MSLGVVDSETRIVDQLQAILRQFGTVVELVLSLQKKYSFDILLDGGLETSVVVIDGDGLVLGQVRLDILFVGGAIFAKAEPIFLHVLPDG